MGFFRWLFSLFKHEGRIEKEIDKEESAVKELSKIETLKKKVEEVDERYDLKENKDIKKSSKYLNKAYRIASSSVQDKIMMMLKQEANIRNNNLMMPNKKVSDQEILTKQNSTIERNLIKNLNTIIEESKDDKRLSKILENVKKLYIEEFHYEEHKLKEEEKEVELNKEEKEKVKELVNEIKKEESS